MYIWVRDEEREVCFWDSSSGLRLECFDDMYFDKIGWKVQLVSESKTTAWSYVTDAPTLIFFEEHYEDLIMAAIQRYEELSE